MNKREYCESRESIAYYSGLNGLEIKGIEHGIDDFIYCVSGAWGGGIVSDMRIDADSVENALEIYRERVEKSIVSLFPKMPLKTSRKCSLIYQTGAQNKLVMLSRVKQNLTRAIMPDIAHNILICG